MPADTEAEVQQLFTAWSGLDTRKKITALVAVAALVVTVVAMTRIANRPSMTLLYAGLENGAAGDVVRALEQRGTAFEVRGGSIYVPTADRDELRLTLASEGLPMTGGRGYELLDSLNGFGTTSQMFDAAYWRAKEGELARTIVAGPFVSQARVHIAHAGSSPFQRSVRPTASVSVVPAGVPITAAQANALRYLVASAVAGLSVDDVAVIDANGALIGQPDAATGPGNPDDRAQTLRERVLRLVEARVGQGNAVVEVSVDTETQTESIRERRFDPEGRVAISTDTEERSDTSKNQGGGDVTVASNLPDGDAVSGDSSSAQASETRERINYEVSETEHEIVRGPGAVRRLTVAVLVNGIQTSAEGGEAVYAERSPEELDALRDLVASAVGYQEDRGDVITIKSMELPASAPLGTAASTSLLSSVHLDVMSILQMAILAVVALILGLFVVRPILARPADAERPALPAPEDDPFADMPAFQTAPALSGEVDDGSGGGFAALPDLGNFAAAGDVSGMPSLTGGSSDPVERLRTMIGERKEETVEILRSWLEESEERA